MQGRIIKGIAGFYYVKTGDGQVYACKGRGLFRLQHVKPLVGDFAAFDITDEKDAEGNITEILPRKNELVRPAVANIDQVMLVIAAASPAPSPVLVDSFLMEDERMGVPTVLVLNKTDLADETTQEKWTRVYRRAGYPVLCIAAKTGEGVDALFDALRGKTTVIAGASGVGKSTLMNRLRQSEDMETGEVSRRERGRHTTRHSELLPLPLGGENPSYLIDTPGFSSFELSPEFIPEQLEDCYPEFAPFLPLCRFTGCAHLAEPDCGVRTAVAEKKISRSRYATYCRFYRELKDRRFPR